MLDPVILPGVGGGEPNEIVNTLAVLLPHALFAVTEILPAVVPAVSMIDVEVLVPVQPVADQVYDIAPETAAILKVSTSPGQYVVGPVILVGVAGGEPNETVSTLGALEPHMLLAVTEILPAVVPAVRIIDVVVLVPVQPGADQVYDVAPETDAILNVSISPGQYVIGPVIVPGIAGGGFLEWPFDGTASTCGSFAQGERAGP